VRDYWRSPLCYGCEHALCNAHHLRDLTYCHEQQKISGCFRSEDRAKVFAIIRSYIDTLRKNGIGIMQALGLAIKGDSFMNLFNP
jgi:hypothetical protein